MTSRTWLILFLPLISFVLLPLIPEEKRKFGGWVACGNMLFAFILTLKLALPLFQGEIFHIYHAPLEWISLPGLKLGEGVTTWENQEFSSEVSKTARVWPHHNNTDGFFLAKVRK